MTKKVQAHTPGPWTIALRQGGPNGASIMNLAGMVVARVPHKADRPIYQKQADLDLLSAAPELLAALKRQHCHVCERYLDEPPSAHPCTFCAKDREAIAKAEHRRKVQEGA